MRIIPIYHETEIESRSMSHSSHTELSLIQDSREKLRSHRIYFFETAGSAAMRYLAIRSPRSNELDPAVQKLKPDQLRVEESNLISDVSFIILYCFLCDFFRLTGGA